MNPQLFILFFRSLKNVSADCNNSPYPAVSHLTAIQVDQVQSPAPPSRQTIIVNASPYHHIVSPVTLEVPPSSVRICMRTDPSLLSLSVSWLWRGFPASQVGKVMVIKKHTKKTAPSPTTAPYPAKSPLPTTAPHPTNGSLVCS